MQVLSLHQLQGVVIGVTTISIGVSVYTCAWFFRKRKLKSVVIGIDKIGEVISLVVVQIFAVISYFDNYNSMDPYQAAYIRLFASCFCMFTSLILVTHIEKNA